MLRGPLHKGGVPSADFDVVEGCAGIGILIDLRKLPQHGHEHTAREHGVRRKAPVADAAHELVDSGILHVRRVPRRCGHVHIAGDVSARRQQQRASLRTGDRCLHIFACDVAVRGLQRAGCDLSAVGHVNERAGRNTHGGVTAQDGEAVAGLELHRVPGEERADAALSGVGAQGGIIRLQRLVKRCLYGGACGFLDAGEQVGRPRLHIAARQQRILPAAGVGCQHGHGAAEQHKNQQQRDQSLDFQEADLLWRSCQAFLVLAARASASSWFSAM